MTHTTTPTTTPVLHDGDSWVCCKCGAGNVAHAYYWCHQVCGKCLQPHWHHRNGELRPDGFYSGQGRVDVAMSIARNGGRYVPTFGGQS